MQYISVRSGYKPNPNGLSELLIKFGFDIAQQRNPLALLTNLLGESFNDRRQQKVISEVLHMGHFYSASLFHS
jgi:hypothetical protein